MVRTFTCVGCGAVRVMCGEGLPAEWRPILGGNGLGYTCGEACRRKLLEPKADPGEETQELPPPAAPEVCVFPGCGKPLCPAGRGLCLGHNLAVFGPYASAADIEHYNRLVREAGKG